MTSYHICTTLVQRMTYSFVRHSIIFVRHSEKSVIITVSHPLKSTSVSVTVMSNISLSLSSLEDEPAGEVMPSSALSSSYGCVIFVCVCFFGCAPNRLMAESSTFIFLCDADVKYFVTTVVMMCSFSSSENDLWFGFDDH